MPVLTSITPADGAVEMWGNGPIIALLTAVPGAKEHRIIETTQAHFATGTLTDVEARPSDTLELLGIHQDDFEAYPTGSFPPSGWTHVSGGTATVELDGGSKTLQVVHTGNQFCTWDAPGTGANVDIYCDFKAAGSFPHYHGLLARYANTSNYYSAAFSSDEANIGRMVGGSWTKLATTTGTWSADTWYRIRFQVIGTTLRMKVWTRGDEEPGSWLLSTTDSSLSGANKVGVRGWSPSSATSRFDNILVAGCSASGKTYPSSGVRVSPSYNLASDVAVFAESRISWTAQVPSGTSLTIEASVNGGAYATCTNGGRIPGVTEGGTATSVQLRMTLETTNPATTPVLEDIALDFFGLDPGLVEIIVNGVSCTTGNALLEYWNHKRITAGAISDNWTTVYFGTRCTWWDWSYAEVPITVRYDGSTIGSATVQASEIDGHPAGTAGHYAAWATAPDWQTGRVDGYYMILNYYPDGERIGWYFIEPPSDGAMDGWYLVGRYLLADVPAGAIVGERSITDAPGAGVVLGWSHQNPPAAAVVQAWLLAGGVAAGLPATVSLADVASAATIGALSTTDGSAAALVYGVNRRTWVEVRSVSAETAAMLDVLGVTRA